MTGEAGTPRPPTCPALCFLTRQDGRDDWRANQQTEKHSRDLSPTRVFYGLLLLLL